jgi:hypothetical protein
VEEARQHSTVILFYALGPLGLLASFLCFRNLWFAWQRGAIRSRGSREGDGWIRRETSPVYFWSVASGNSFAAVWFGLVGLVVLAKVTGVLG